jgi:hypothetical protein
MCRTSASNNTGKPITAFASSPFEVQVPAVPSAAVLNAVGMSSTSITNASSVSSIPATTTPAATSQIVIDTSVPVMLNKSGKRSALPVPACVNCRKSKVKCVGGIPCKRCLRLDMTSSCARCPPKKRGRKRKSQTATDKKSTESKSVASTPLVKADRKRASTRARRARTTQQKRAKVEPRQKNQARAGPAAAAAAAVSSLLDMPMVRIPSCIPPVSPANEGVFVETFKCLCSQFRSWRDELLHDVNVDNTKMSRFLWFASHLSHVTKEFLGSVQMTGSINSNMASVQLCQSLVSDINNFVCSLGEDASRLPAIDPAAVSSLQSGIEHEVYKTVPVGAVCLPMNPLPFSSRATHAAWVNPAFSDIIGHSSTELSSRMSNLHSFLQLLDASSISEFLSSTWRAVAAGQAEFSTNLTWVTKTGVPVEMACNHSLRYSNGVPFVHLIFVQVLNSQSASDDLELVMPWGSDDAFDNTGSDTDHGHHNDSSTSSDSSSTGSDSSSSGSSSYHDAFGRNYSYAALNDTPQLLDIPSAHSGFVSDQQVFPSSSPDELAMSIAAALEFIPPLYHEDNLPSDTDLTFDDSDLSSSSSGADHDVSVIDTQMPVNDDQVYRELASDFETSPQPSIDIDRDALATNSWTSPNAIPSSLFDVPPPAKPSPMMMPFPMPETNSSLADLLLYSAPVEDTRLDFF